MIEKYNAAATTTFSARKKYEFTLVNNLHICFSIRFRTCGIPNAEGPTPDEDEDEPPPSTPGCEFVVRIPPPLPWWWWWCEYPPPPNPLKATALLVLKTPLKTSRRSRKALNLALCIKTIDGNTHSLKQLQS